MQKKVILAIAVAAIVIAAGVAVAYLMSRPQKTGVVYYVTVSPPSNMKGQLASGSTDGFIAWEPFGADAVVGDVGEVLEWSSDIMPNHPCCVVVASTDYIATEPGKNITQHFIKAHVEATKWMVNAMSDKTSSDYQLLLKLGVQFTGRNETVLKMSFDHLKYGYQMDAAFTGGVTNFTQAFIDAGVVKPEKITGGGYSNVTDFIAKYTNKTFLTGEASVLPVTPGEYLNPSDPVRIGFLGADLHQLAEWVAQNKTVGGGSMSLFDKYGVKVTNATATGYTSGPNEMTAFAGGEVDIGYLGCAPAIQAHLNAEVHTVILAQANSEGSAIIVKAGAGISSVKDLEGKTIAVPSTGAIQFSLLKLAVEKAGLQLEVKVV